MRATKTTGIYAIRNKTNGKVYIGKTTTDFANRWRSHRSKLRRGVHSNSHLQSAWLLYGEIAFVFEMVEVIPRDKNVLIGEREVFWVVHHKAQNRTYGYNLVEPLPEGGHVITEETRAKMRSAQLGKKRSPEAVAKTAAAHRGMKRSVVTVERLRRANTGQKVTVGQRRHLSASRKGVPLSPEHRAHMSLARKGRKPTRLSDQDRKEVVRRYNAGETRRDLAQEYGVTPHYISMLRTQAQRTPLKKQFLRISKAAKILGISPQTLRKWAQKGKICVSRTPGGHRLIPLEEIERLQEHPS